MSEAAFLAARAAASGITARLAAAAVEQLTGHAPLDVVSFPARFATTIWWRSPRT